MSPNWYDDRPEAEEAHRGKLAARPPVLSPGGRTRLLYELQRVGEAPVPIYAPSLEDALERLTGSDVALVGKMIDLTDEGFGIELWLPPTSLPS